MHRVGQETQIVIEVWGASNPVTVTVPRCLGKAQMKQWIGGLDFFQWKCLE